MPKITTVREERRIYRPEWETTLAKADEEVGLWLACWLAFDCIFGKRRNEICKLKRKDIWVQDDYLFVRFYVGKKRSKTASIDLMPYTKRKTLKHYAMHYILEHLEAYDEWQKTSKKQTDYLFPSNKKYSTERKVTTAFTNGKGERERRSYTYKLETGYVRGWEVYKLVKNVNPNMWLHLGRHTVASDAAEDGASEYDICNILDVTPRVAGKYVHHGTALTDKWSQKTG